MDEFDEFDEFDLLKMSKAEVDEFFRKVDERCRKWRENCTEEEWRAREAFYARCLAEDGYDYTMEEPPASCKKNVKPSSRSK